MDKKAKRRICISLVIFVAIFFVIALIYINFNKDDNDNNQTKAEYEHYLQLSPSVIFGCTFSLELPKVSCNNDLVYYYSDLNNSITEYDLLSGTATEIAVKTAANNRYSYLNMYDGVLYALEQDYNSIEDSSAYSIVSIDYNEGTVKDVYTTGDYETVIGCLNMSNDGFFYFIEGKYDENNNDENGYNESYALYKYDLTTNQKTELVKANTFYIDSGVIYYTKLDPQNDVLNLFYAPLDNPQNETDTGVKICDEVSKSKIYMYYPHNGKVYYAYSTYQLFCYDPETGETETTATFSEESNVWYFQYFGDDLIVFVREPYERESCSQSGLYYLRDGGEPVRITGDDEFNENYIDTYESLNYVSIFNQTNDAFVVATYNPSVETNIYIMDKDYNMTKIISDGEWDYEAFAEMQMQMEIG